jgi:hypothetical protein
MIDIMRSLDALLGLFAGCGIGLFHFALLRANVYIYLSGAPLVRAITMQGLRLGVTVIAFSQVLHLGVLPLLEACVGFIVARRIVIEASQ